MASKGWFAIRADAAIHIGTGHLMRCLTLAKALQLRGYQGYLLSVDLPEVCRELLDNSEVKLVSLPCNTRRYSDTNCGIYAHSHWLKHDENSDLQQTEDAIKKLTLQLGEQPALIIVDHYALAAPWESALSQYAPVLAIDDLNDRRHSARWVLDQTVGKTPLNYQGLLGLNTTLLLGGQYVLLREEFAILRERALAKRRQPTPVKRILITLGGADQQNMTTNILCGLHSIGLASDIFVDVVVGAINPHVEALQSLGGDLSYQMQVSVAVNDMAQRMFEADICIGAAGATAWERCALGLPSINLVLANNQKVIAKNISDAGAAFLVDMTNDHLMQRLPALVHTLINDADQRLVMSDKASLVCDGFGVDRVVKELIGEY